MNKKINIRFMKSSCMNKKNYTIEVFFRPYFLSYQHNLFNNHGVW